MSRGGHKLEAALDAFGIDPARARVRWTSARPPAASRTCCCSAARGASTRWTSDGASWPSACGATRGSSSLERTNARTLTPDAARRTRGPRRHRRVVHLARARPRAGRRVLRAGGGPIVALVKPQFEAGRGQTDAGVVRDPAVHRAGPGARCARRRGARPGAARRHRVAAPRAGRQSRVPVPPRGPAGTGSDGPAPRSTSAGSRASTSWRAA